MCSGRVDPDFILRAFSNGMDGVIIGGCRLNECNYITHGNYHALNMVLLMKKILQHMGLNPDRLTIKFMSSGEGNLFTEAIDDFVKNVRTLGPLGEGEGLSDAELKEKIAAVRNLVPYIKMTKRDKLESPLYNPADYDSYFTAEEIEEMFRDVVSYHIDPEKCQACMICARRCPVDAIEGGKGRIHVIDQDKCIKCGTCYEACPPRFGAVQQIVHAPVPPPIPEADRVVARKPKPQQANA